LKQSRHQRILGHDNGPASHRSSRHAARPKRRQGWPLPGCVLAEDEPPAGYDRGYVYDPFGNRIELLQRPDAH
jgi:hypothetical protein